MVFATLYEVGDGENWEECKWLDVLGVVVVVVVVEAVAVKWWQQ